MSVAAVYGLLEAVPAHAWQALSRRRLFFGHRSVGRDLVEGLERLVPKYCVPPFAIHRRRSPAESRDPGFYELDIGSNRSPMTKDAALAAILEQGFGDEPGAIAMQKYCYVDVGEYADPAQLFDQYRAHMTRLRQRHPRLTLVHFTIPLQSVASNFPEWLAGWAGIATRSSMNARREAFNDLIRRQFAGKELLFDIAAMESTRADERRAVGRYRGAKIPALAGEWTYDGGHLNQAGKDWVAANFLAFLAALP
jgi:hypothetical protein